MCVIREKRFLNTGLRWLHQSTRHLTRFCALACLLACALSGAAATLWTEGFEGTFPPVGWIENSVDQTNTYKFNESNYSAKLGAVADFLITPKITTGQTLIFWTHTTPSDPDIVIDYASSTSGPWTEFPESPFSGYTDQWNGQWIDLSTFTDIYVRFQKSGGGSLYIDDVSLEDGIAVSNQPPILDSIGDRTIFENDSLNFTVTASDPVDGDPITLTATNLPTGAIFSNDTFIWNNAAPVGTYTITFTATDKDGSDSETNTITILERPKLLISEIADPYGTGADAYRFIELYNAGTNAIDLAAENWFLCKQVNGGTWTDIPLSGIVSSTWTIAFSAPDFEAAYGVSPDQESSSVSGNGDDAYFLYYDGNHTNGILIDAYGEFDTDGTDTDWEYEDSLAVRQNHILEPNANWTTAEWTIESGASTNDMTPGEHGPRPVFQGLENVFVFLGDDLSLLVSAVNTVRTDVITLSATHLPAGAIFQANTLTWSRPPTGIYTVTFSAEGQNGTTTESITITVSSTSEIDGKFYGWKNDTIIKLKNGQFWRNTGGVSDSIDPPLRKPDATITNQFGSRRIFVEDVTGYKTVERIDIIESNLDSPFSGLRNGNLYELDDGTIWKQISFENIPSTADPVTAWRWVENGKTTIRFLDRDDAVIGTCEVVPSGAPTNPPIISRIDGWFRGWENRRIFALQNGQFWQQIVVKDSIDALQTPVATVTNHLGTGTWRLIIEGSGPPNYVEVRQLTHVTRTAIDGTFYGFGLRNIFHLANGSWWQQTSLDSSVSKHWKPDVFFWNEAGADRLEFPTLGKSITAKQLNIHLESIITNRFTGLRYRNLYCLEHGGDWLQISFETANANLVAPEIMLWTEGSKTHMVMRDENDETIGTCTVVMPDVDSDGDQISNAAEALAGTDMFDAQSKFEVTETTRNEMGQTVLHWNAIEDRIYTIEWTPSLTEKFQPLETVAWPQNSWTDTVHSVETQGFYRINVRLND